MTYTQQGEQVTLEMTVAEYGQLLTLLGFAFGAAMREGDSRIAYRWLAFANAMNATNPFWTPYEIPEEFRS